MRSPGMAEVREAVQDLRDEGTSYIKSRGVARQLGLERERSVCTAIGYHLKDLAEDDDVQVALYSTGSASNVYRLTEAPELVADGSGHECDACGDTFRTLTRLRLHEKDDCPGREMFADIDPHAPDPGGQAAEGLLTCRECGRANPDADYDETPSLAGDDYHLIVEFACRHCSHENENRVVLEGIDQSNLDQLPPKLQPTETDGGHDLDALRDGIRATVEADDDTVRRVDDYAFRALDNWCGSPVSHVAVDYAQEPNWLVVPFDFADVVTDAIAERLDDDRELRTDGGQTLPAPSNRDFVGERLEERTFVDDVSPCGPGLRFSYNGNGDHTFTNMMETHGWYLASYSEETQTGVFMPLPRGDDDDE